MQFLKHDKMHMYQIKLIIFLSYSVNSFHYSIISHWCMKKITKLLLMFLINSSKFLKNIILKRQTFLTCHIKGYFLFCSEIIIKLQLWVIFPCFLNLGEKKLTSDVALLQSMKTFSYKFVLSSQNHFISVITFYSVCD